MQIDNHVLTISDFTQELPRLATAATVTVWSVPPEYQPSGYFVAVTPTGSPRDMPACDSKDIVLVGSLELAPDAAAQLAAAKAERLGAINIGCDLALAAITTNYPSSEISTWPQQVKEAEALVIDPQANAHLLPALAAARGITVSDLAARVMAKAMAFAEVSGQVIGRRQALEDALAAATTPGDVSTVRWEG